MLRPGTEASITVVLLNVGSRQSFRISVIADASNEGVPFQYTVNNSNPLVAQNAQAYIAITVSFPSDAPLGLSVTFTVVAQSTNDYNINDFISFDVVNVREVSIQVQISAVL